MYGWTKTRLVYAKVNMDNSLGYGKNCRVGRLTKGKLRITRAVVCGQGLKMQLLVGDDVQAQ